MDNDTKEYLDVKFLGIDKRFDGMDEQLKKQQEAINDLAGMTARGFTDIAQRLDVRERVQTLEVFMQKVSKALNL